MNLKELKDTIIILPKIVDFYCKNADVIKKIGRGP